jgi:3-deoxy-manno-octulosonate cytidylyltransferase (CMP-KDO synthetase)
MSAPEFVVAIPARLTSTRLPGKLLLDLAGRPLVSHTISTALAAGGREVVVATDSQEIAQAIEQYHPTEPVTVVMTRSDHPSGTDRLAEAAALRGWTDDTLVVNLQGDEPLLPPAAISQVAQCLADQPQAVAATLASPLHDGAQLIQSACVKLVTNRLGLALYFSRAPIPFDRDAWAGSGAPASELAAGWWRHIGIYAYRAGFLSQYAQLAKGQLEQLESLEQLRILEHGYAMAVGYLSEHPAPGVDTAEDLERVRRLLT